MSETHGNYFPIFSATVEKQKKKDRCFDQFIWPITLEKTSNQKSLSKQTIKDTMDSLYGDTWTTYPSCAYLFDHMHELDHSNKRTRWTEKYRPSRVAGLLGSKDNHHYLKEWLEKLKVKPITVEKKKKYKEDDALYNMMVLVGGHGSGKTASVMTAAKEADYSVNEMNSSSRRAGKDVIDTLGGMTESHLVRFDSHTQKRKYEGEKLVIKDTVKKQKKTFDMMQHFKQLSTQEEPKKTAIHSFFTETRDKIKKMENDKKLKSQPKQSLILLEEVDLLYEEDKGFWSSVYELNRKSKRPVILTCNDESLVPFDNLYIQDILYYELPDRDTLQCYIQLICLIENHYIEPIDILFVCSYFDDDTRHILDNLQLWLNEEKSKDEHYYYTYLFAHMIGFFDLIQQPTSMVKLIDRLQGLDTRKKDICKQYYVEMTQENQQEQVSIESLCHLMENASFADAYIGLTEKKRHQLYDIDQYNKQDMYQQDLRMIYKEPNDYDHLETSQVIEDTLQMLNITTAIKDKMWRNPIMIWSSHWQHLCDKRSTYAKKVWDIVYPTILSYELIGSLVMMEYMPEIRNMSKYDQGVPRYKRTRKRKRYLAIDYEAREFIDWEKKNLSSFYKITSRSPS